jgi:hypothetical protein
MRRFAKLVTLQTLRAYKWAISPLFPPACRYVPTCSEYAMEAVERYGVLRGGVMAFARLMRCHPLVRGGYDPVVKIGDSSSGQPAADDRRPTTGDRQSTTPAVYHRAV